MESVNTSEINIEERIAAESLVIDIDGFEGPLDVLLTLARTQKVDMRKISILQLARQYLAFVEAAKRIRLLLLHILGCKYGRTNRDCKGNEAKESRALLYKVLL